MPRGRRDERAPHPRVGVVDEAAGQQHDVEALVEPQGLDVRLHAAHARRHVRQHVGGVVDAGDDAAEIEQAMRQQAGAAAEFEDCGAGRQQCLQMVDLAGVVLAAVELHGAAVAGARAGAGAGEFEGRVHGRQGYPFARRIVAEGVRTLLEFAARRCRKQPYRSRIEAKA